MLSIYKVDLIVTLVSPCLYASNWKRIVLGIVHLDCVDLLYTLSRPKTVTSIDNILDVNGQTVMQIAIDLNPLHNGPHKHGF